MSTWFVDEAGDPTLFGRYGKHNVGLEGCSRFFMLGKLECDDLPALEADLTALRGQLLSDAYLASIASMQAGRGKTALAFHAKNDAPEVRYEVFRLLARHPLRFVAAVCDKAALLRRELGKQAASAGYAYDNKGNALYDALTHQLFARWHGDYDASSDVVFAQRGAKPRTQAFAAAIHRAETEFERAMGLRKPAIAQVHCALSRSSLGLQAVDYYLWALQRFYERGEERYVQFIWPQVLEVLDPDAAPLTVQGVHQRLTSVAGGIYTKSNPLTLANRAGIRVASAHDTAHKNASTVAGVEYGVGDIE